MSFKTFRTTLFNSDVFDYIVSCSALSAEDASWGERYADGLNCIRRESEECMGISADDEDYVPMTEEQIIDDVRNCISMDFDTLVYDVKKLDGECIVFGTIGRWDGRVKGFEFAPSVYDAIMDFIRNLDGFKVEQVNGHLEVSGYHHDGSNSCEIHLLNDKGIRVKERIEDGCDVKADITDRHYHKAMAHYLWCA